MVADTSPTVNSSPGGGQPSAVPLSVGMTVLVPVHSIALRLRELPGFSNQGETSLYSIALKNGAAFIRVHVIAHNLEEGAHDAHARLLRRVKFYVTGLTMLTFGHMWVEHVLLSEDLNLIWREPRTLALVKDKEIDASGPLDLEDSDIAYSTQLAGWIAAQYPQVLTFHASGLFLMRSSLGYQYADYYYCAEAVVAFFRMVEAVTARRSGNRRPELKDVIREARTIGVAKDDGSSEGSGFSEAEITQIYVTRSGPSAHGAELAVVKREEAVEAKLFAEMMVVKDYLARRGGPIDVGGRFCGGAGPRKDRVPPGAS